MVNTAPFVYGFDSRSYFTTWKIYRQVFMWKFIVFVEVLWATVKINRFFNLDSYTHYVCDICIYLTLLCLHFKLITDALIILYRTYHQ